MRDRLLRQPRGHVRSVHGAAGGKGTIPCPPGAAPRLCCGKPPFSRLPSCVRRDPHARPAIRVAPGSAGLGGKLVSLRARAGSEPAARPAGRSSASGTRTGTPRGSPCPPAGGPAASGDVEEEDGRDRMDSGRRHPDGCIRPHQGAGQQSPGLAWVGFCPCSEQKHHPLSEAFVPSTPWPGDFPPHSGTQRQRRRPGGLSEPEGALCPVSPEHAAPPLAENRQPGALGGGQGADSPVRMRPSSLPSGHAFSSHTPSPTTGRWLWSCRDSRVGYTRGQPCRLNVAPPEGSAAAPSLLGAAGQ